LGLGFRVRVRVSVSPNRVSAKRVSAKRVSANRVSANLVSANRDWTVLNLLEAIYLRLRNIVAERVTVVKFRVDSRGSDGILAVLESR